MAISTSSLLSSAAARRNKIQQQEDDLVSFEWSLSAKTYADFAAYTGYLQDRASKSGDVSQQLTYQKAIVGARKGFISNEIQRANIDIIEGRSDNNAKYSKMVDLYYQAIENGDYDLAQNLNLQLDNLSVKIQQEQIAKQEAAQRVASTLANNQVKDLKALKKKIEKGTEEIVLGDGRIIAPIAMINKELKNGNVNDYFANLYDTTKALQALTIDTYNAATDQETVDKIEGDSTLKGLIDGTASFATVTGNDGKEKKLDMKNIELAYRSAAANNPIYSLESRLDPSTGTQTFGLKENKIDDFAWTRNDDGTYSATQVRSTNKPAFQSLKTKITEEGYIVGEGGKLGDGTTIKNPKDDSITIENRLKSLGVVIQGENSDGTFDVLIPNVGQTKATIMPDGSVRYFGAPGQFSGESAGLYEINLLNGGGTREVAPDEASDFGNTSVFGGLLSQPSERGKNYIKNLAGLNRQSIDELAPVDLRTARLDGMGQPMLRTNGISTALDFSGRGSAVTTKLLPGASFTQGNIQKEKLEAIRLQAERESATRLQQGFGGFDLNQTPVAQFASNGAPIKQLTVAKPQAQPTVRVAPVQNPTLKKGVVTKPGAGQLNTGGWTLPGSNFRLQ